MTLDTLEVTAELAIVVGIRLDPLDLLSVFREDGDGDGIGVYIESDEDGRIGHGSWISSLQDACMRLYLVAYTCMVTRANAGDPGPSIVSIRVSVKLLHTRLGGAPQ